MVDIISSLYSTYLPPPPLSSYMTYFTNHSMYNVIICGADAAAQLSPSKHTHVKVMHAKKSVKERNSCFVSSSCPQKQELLYTIFMVHLFMFCYIDITKPATSNFPFLPPPSPLVPGDAWSEYLKKKKKKRRGMYCCNSKLWKSNSLCYYRRNFSLTEGENDEEHYENRS